MALKLSLNLIGRPDLNRLVRELNKIDDFFVASAARKSGTASGTPPRITRLLDQLARDNRINLLEAGQRKSLEAEIKKLLAEAPLFNISFAAEPSPKAMEEILAWFRTNIHPQSLLQVGLAPSIAAGCILRTPNKLFDMSLSSYLEKQEPYLAKLIDGAKA